MRIRGEGPIPSRIMLVGEQPGVQEERTGEAFGGFTGQELNRLLQEAGIMRSECYTTLVAKTQPPAYGSFVAGKKKDVSPSHQLLKGKWVTREVVEGYAELLAEIKLVQPNIIVAFGNLAMWVLTEKWGVVKWRGSQLEFTDGSFTCKVIPTIHPSQIVKQWELRALILTDLRRVKRHLTSKVYNDKPQWNFIVRPSFDTALRTIQTLTSDATASVEPVWLDFDIETRYGHIDCIGFSWSHIDGICIPFVARGKPSGYWSEDEEATIIYALYKLLTHSNVKIRWQNGLYDAQYVHKHWHFIPNNGQDTMISHHSVYAALPKGLSFLASLYSPWYVYWKDEGKIASDVPEEQRWTYNLQDCVYTRIVGEVLQDTLKILELESVELQQQRLFSPVLRAMLKGVWVDPSRKEKMALDIQEELSKREAFLYTVLGHSINPRSSKQMCALFYDDLKQQPILKRSMVDGRVRMSPTCDDEALQKLAAREPLLRPLTNVISDIRTLNKYLSDFVGMPLDPDGRMRCSYNIAGDAGGKSAPYSYRLSSSENAFGNGGNLQTIPSDKSKSAGKAAARGSMDFTLPNIRSMYCPDTGYTFFDMDLDRADLQVVVWESGEEAWRKQLQQGIDMHLMNAFMLNHREPPPLNELVETHPNYYDHRYPLRHDREFSKVFCHATNYLGKPKTVAAHTGRTVHEIDQAQKYWFSIHPGIPSWHKRVWEQMSKRRFVENRFGYRWYIFDRVDENLLPEGVAWIPQSTVGIVINKIWDAFYTNIPELQILLQVHDSLAGQFPTHRRETILPLMQHHSKIIVPYEQPLIIPTGVKTSTSSWGECA